MMRLFDQGVLSPEAALQDLYADETAPRQGRDAAQEEIHHLIIGFGWAKAFADRFDDRSATSAIRRAWAQADAAGHYAYDDPTCDTACLTMEFVYKATAAYLGADSDLADDEIRLKTRAALRAQAPAIVAIFESADYNYPRTAWPDGAYGHPRHIVYIDGAAG